LSVPQSSATLDLQLGNTTLLCASFANFLSFTGLLLRFVEDKTEASELYEKLDSNEPCSTENLFEDSLCGFVFESLSGVGGRIDGFTTRLPESHHKGLSAI
jgi:hypothetical protein